LGGVGMELPGGVKLGVLGAGVLGWVKLGLTGVPEFGTPLLPAEPDWA